MESKQQDQRLRGNTKLIPLNRRNTEGVNIRLNTEEAHTGRRQFTREKKQAHRQKTDKTRTTHRWDGYRFYMSRHNRGMGRTQGPTSPNGTR